MKIIGIGDSNWEKGGHGWKHGFSQVADCETLIYYPGGDTREVLQRLRGMDVTEADVPEDATVMVTLGINDSIYGIPWHEYCKNHVRIKDTLEAMVGPRRWVWMPGHWQYPGSPIHKEMENPFFLPFFYGLRAALRYKAKKQNIPFVDLRKHKDATIYNAPFDPFHLSKESYERIAARVVAEGWG